MAKYLFEITYSATGLQEILKEGGIKRKEEINIAIRSLEGWMEALYFSFGEVDMYVVAEMPDNVSAAAFSMIASSSGAAKIRTIVLVPPDDIDRAVKKKNNYKPVEE